MTAFTRYRIEHRTEYRYSARVSMSQHMACFTPRALARQIPVEHQLVVDPAAEDVVSRTDYFGNEVQHFTILTPSRHVSATSRSVVDVAGRTEAIDPDASAAWEDVRDEFRFRRGAHPSDAVEFTFESPYVECGAELRAFALRAFLPRRPILAAALDLMRLIHDEFTFDPGTTSVTTPVTKVLSLRQGVCQDFAHLQIGCIRSLGLAARYVSGYLLTDPPPGQPRLVGADASHAWLAVHAPGFGWLDIDPTNAVIPDIRHITLAWGRDFGDVSPLRGVVLGGGEEVLSVGVSVSPVGEGTLAI